MEKILSKFAYPIEIADAYGEVAFSNCLFNGIPDVYNIEGPKQVRRPYFGINVLKLHLIGPKLATWPLSADRDESDSENIQALYHSVQILFLEPLFATFGAQTHVVDTCLVCKIPLLA